MNTPIHHMLPQLPAAGLGRWLVLASLTAVAFPGIASSYVAPQVVTAEVVVDSGPASGIGRFYGIDADAAGSWVTSAQVANSFDRVLYGVIAGSATTAPSILRTPQTLHGYPQELIFRARVQSGRVSYSASVASPASGFSSWVDDLLIAAPGMPIGTTGLEWLASGTPRLSTGQRVFVLGTAAPVGTASPSSRVVVSYPTESIALSTGPGVTGLSGPVTQIHSFEASPSGAWWVAVVSYASPVTTREEMAILLDGNVHLLYGFTRASTEQGLWVSFTTARVNDDREVTFLGHDQSGGVVFRNGRPALKGLLNDFADVDRDGLVLTNTSVNQGLGVVLDGLSLDRFGAGGVDANGDGSPNAGWSVVGPAGATPRAAFLGDGRVLALASIQSPGAGARDAVVLASLALPANIICAGVANSYGDTSTLRAIGTDRVAFNDLELRMTSVPPTVLMLPLVSNTASFVANPAGSFGNLCLGGAVGRGLPIPLAPGGSQTLRVYPSSLPQPNGAAAAQAGQTWYFQVWYRDSQMGMAGSNFSSALGVTFR